LKKSTNPKRKIGTDASMAMRRRPVRSARCPSHGPSVMSPMPKTVKIIPTSNVDHPSRCVANGA